MLLSTGARTTHKCPGCGTHQVCRAHRVDGLDRVLSLVNIYPYRCRQLRCKIRFHRFGRSV